MAAAEEAVAAAHARWRAHRAGRARTSVQAALDADAACRRQAHDAERRLLGLQRTCLLRCQKSVTCVRFLDARR